MKGACAAKRGQQGGLNKNQTALELGRERLKRIQTGAVVNFCTLRPAHHR